MNDHNPPVDPGTKISELFCATDSDITFQSSDGVLFQLHRKNLEVSTGGFPPSEIETRDEIVPLTEHSSTLELLFQFIYPQRHPYLESTAFELLAPLAEAAEKYEVFSAMNTCRSRMRGVLSRQPLEVMLYAAKHDYPEISREAAPHLLHIPLDEIVTKLSANLNYVVPWVRYYESWRKIFNNAIHSYSDWVPGRLGRKMMGCNSCSSNLDTIFVKLTCELKDVNLKTLDTIGSDIHCCVHIQDTIHRWRIWLKQETQRIPTFDTFL